MLLFTGNGLMRILNKKMQQGSVVRGLEEK